MSVSFNTSVTSFLCLLIMCTINTLWTLWNNGQNYNGRSDTVFCGVFDGHGPHGHLIARKVRDILPSRLCDLIYEDCGDSPTSNSDVSTLEENLSLYADAECRSPTLAGQKEHQEFFNAMKESFRKAFKNVDKELKLQRNIDSICSGTTAVTLIKQVSSFLFLM